jgi:transposase
MKKRAYRAVSVNKVRIDDLASQLEGGRVSVGVDVAKEKFYAAFMDEDQSVVMTVHWQHPAETPKFIDVLAGLSSSQVDVVTEPSGSYGLALEEQLRRAQFSLYQVSPKRSHDAAEVYDGVPSHHDAKAAAIIAKLHLDRKSHPLQVRPVDRRELCASLQVMDDYHDHLRRLLNKLEALVAAYWPELAQHLSLDTASALSLLSTYGCASQVASQSAAARRLLHRVSCGKLKPETLDGVLSSACTSLGVKPVAGEIRAVQELASEALRSRKQLHVWEQKVRKQSQHYEPVQRMSARAGAITAAVFYSDLGSASDYASPQAFIKAAGINLKINQSGKKKGQLSITKRGPSRCRKYLMLMALRMIQQDEVVRAWYEKKASRDGKVKMKAVVAVMRKLLAALWHVSRGAVFDSSKLFDVSRLQLPSTSTC